MTDSRPAVTSLSPRRVTGARYTNSTNINTAHISVLYNGAVTYVLSCLTNDKLHSSQTTHAFINHHVVCVQQDTALSLSCSRKSEYDTMIRYDNRDWKANCSQLNLAQVTRNWKNIWKETKTKRITWRHFSSLVTNTLSTLQVVGLMSCFINVQFTYR